MAELEKYSDSRSSDDNESFSSGSYGKNRDKVGYDNES